MRVLLKDQLIVLVPETAEETAEIAAWTSAHADHVLSVRASQDAALELHDLGPRPDACREPINIVGSSADPIARAISNFATAPFALDGRHYRSVESFWQGLKFADDADRNRIAALDGPLAQAEGAKQGYGATVTYDGEIIAVGTSRHWRLMERACRAKFEQDAQARAALLATGERPLIHVVRRDSTAIPGVIMAQIWTRIRARIRTGVPADTEEEQD